MAERAPTVRQFGILLALGSGAAGLSRTKRDTVPLLRRGWVTAEWRPPFFQFVRITPDGLRALAAGVERYGLPDLGSAAQAKVCADCGRDWRPRCRCGGAAWRFETRGVARG